MHCPTRSLCRGEEKGAAGCSPREPGPGGGSRQSRGCLASEGLWRIAYPLPTSVFPKVNESQTAAAEALSPIHLLSADLTFSACVFAGGTVFHHKGFEDKGLCPVAVPPHQGLAGIRMWMGKEKVASEDPPHPKAQLGSSHIISAHLPLARINQTAIPGLGPWLGV